MSESEVDELSTGADRREAGIGRTRRPRTSLDDVLQTVLGRGGPDAPPPLDGLADRLRSMSRAATAATTHPDISGASSPDLAEAISEMRRSEARTASLIDGLIARSRDSERRTAEALDAVIRSTRDAEARTATALNAVANWIDRAAGAIDPSAVSRSAAAFDERLAALASGIDRLARKDGHADDAAALIERIDQTVRTVHAPLQQGLTTRLDQLTREVVELRGQLETQGIAALRADIAGLSTRVDDVAARIEQLGGGLDEVRQAIVEAPLAVEPEGVDQMAASLAEMRRALDVVSAQAARQGSTAALEQALSSLAARLEQSPPMASDVVESRLAAFANHVDEARRAWADDIEQAVRRATRDTLAALPASGLERVQRDIETLSARQEAADRRHLAAIEAMQALIDQLVARMAPPGGTPSAAAALAEPAMAGRAGGPVIHPGGSPLEPGSPRPVALTARPIDQRAALIAAARRAAQAPVESPAPSTEAPAIDAATVVDVAAPASPEGVASFHERRRRPLLIALALVALGLAAVLAARLAAPTPPPPARLSGALTAPNAVIPDMPTTGSHDPGEPIALSDWRDMKTQASIR